VGVKKRRKEMAGGGGAGESVWTRKQKFRLDKVDMGK